MSILRNSLLYISFASVVSIASVASVLYFGFNPSIDFSGGTVYEIAYDQEIEHPNKLVKKIRTSFVGARVDVSENKEALISLTDTKQEHVDTLNTILKQSGEYSPVRLNTLSPSISSELVNKSITAVIVVILIIIAFIAYTFRGVSAPVASWKYGLVAIVALVHDTIIPIGIFAFLGSLFIDFQIDVLFITAILATLGYSVNDTIVVFDRVRENLSRAHKEHTVIRGEAFREIVGASLNASLRRSFFTSLTTLSVLIVLFIVGGPTTQTFALVLAVGVLAGTYSSLCVACPLLVWIERFSKDQTPSLQKKGENDDSGLPDDVQRFLQKQKST